MCPEGTWRAADALLINSSMLNKHGLSADLQPLEGFYRVARERGYARAARTFRYPISQPGLHQQVRKLEAELGVRLFERVAHAELELTSAGRELYDFCAPFFERLPAVLQSVASGAHTRVLRVEAGALEIRHIVPAWLQKLRRTSADVRVDLCETELPDVERLTRGKIDLLIEYLPRLPRGVGAKRLGAHHGFIVCPSDWLDDPAPSSLRSWLRVLQGRPLVGYSSVLPQHNLQQSALFRLGVAHSRTLTASSTEAILGFVSAGLGFSVIPWPNERGPSVPSVAARRVRGATYPVCVAWRQSAAADPVIVAALAAFAA